jgi:uncharacterized protein YdbL (DUF1318 family)
MMRKLLLTVALAGVAGPGIAQTAAVNAARAAGIIGERYDGYLGIAGAATPSLRSQVASINIQRRSIYSNLGASRRASPNQVGIAAGCQLLGRVGVGEAYLWADGQWRHRARGQPAPVPSYCG